MLAAMLRLFAKSLAMAPLALIASSGVACADTWRDPEAPREDYWGAEAPPPGVSTATAPPPESTSLGSVETVGEDTAAPAPPAAPPESAEDTDPAAVTTAACIWDDPAVRERRAASPGTG